MATESALPRRVSHGCRNGLMGAPDCLQRHFCVFAVSFPGQEALTTIYSTILAQHLSFRSTPLVIQRLCSNLVTAALGKLRPPPLQPGSESRCLWAGRGKYFIYSSESRYIYIFFLMVQCCSPERCEIQWLVGVGERRADLQQQQQQQRGPALLREPRRCLC